MLFFWYRRCSAGIVGTEQSRPKMNKLYLSLSQGLSSTKSFSCSTISTLVLISHTHLLSASRIEFAKSQQQRFASGLVRSITIFVFVTSRLRKPRQLPALFQHRPFRQSLCRSRSSRLGFQIKPSVRAVGTPFPPVQVPIRLPVTEVGQQ
jgi:hypothetical protein